MFSSIWKKTQATSFVWWDKKFLQIRAIYMRLKNALNSPLYPKFHSSEECMVMKSSSDGFANGFTLCGFSRISPFMYLTVISQMVWIPSSFLWNFSTILRKKWHYIKMRFQIMLGNNKNDLIVFNISGRVAQRITRLPTEQKIAGSSPAVVEIFLKFSW